MKRVYIILAFHGHEPLWDLPSKILADSVQDQQMRNSIRSENWIKIRADAKRDVYSDLITFGDQLDVPVALEATNELLVQLAQFAPATHSRIADGYKRGRLYPVYGHAHHAHIALVDDRVMQDEIRLNDEYIHDVMQAPRPRYRGLFPTEDSIDANKLKGIVDAGIDYVIFPNLSPRKAHYVSDKPFNEQHEPFLFGRDIIGLPRHFPVSQGIWRPVTRMRPEGVKYQGYLLGRYWVFDQEYQKRRFVSFPIDKDQGVKEYQGIIERALKDSPDKGLILYIQDLELMDFGDVALEIMLEAWRRVRAAGQYEVRVVTPDEYIDSEVKPRLGDLPRLRFHQISWAPEIRLVLRYDGHYPPLHAGEYRRRDLTVEVFRRWPFIFWEPGRYLADITDDLLRMFGCDVVLTETARHLAEVDYRVATLSVNSRLALHSRLMRRACNWGWFPNESLQKRPFLHCYALLDLLLQQMGRGSVAARLEGQAVFLSDNSLCGLGRILEIILDTRHSYLIEGITRLQATTGRDQGAALAELDRARDYRDEAERHIYSARERAKPRNGRVDRSNTDALRAILTDLKSYCRAVFLSIDHIQRAWMNASDVDAVLVTMYDHLYHLYPPKFPAILESTLDDAELEAIDHPSLK